MIDFNELEKAIEEQHKYLLSKGWTQDQIDKEGRDAFDIQLGRELDEAGFIPVYTKTRTLSKSRERVEQRYLHPDTNRIYRYLDAIYMVGPNPIAEDIFYKEATGWAKKLNTKLVEQGITLTKDDLITYGPAEGENDELDYEIIEIRKISKEELNGA